jgi:hypothetical protein
MSHVEKAAPRGYLVGIGAWLVPGLGHLILGKIGRSLLLGGAVLTMFLLGLLLGGHLFSLQNASEVGLLAYVYGFCDVGLGLLYFLSSLLGIAVTDKAQLPTAEYGNIFMMISGLLNFLAALDAFDLSVRRKS